MQELDPSYLSPEINQCYQSFPFTPPNVSPISVTSTVESFLPSIERAIQLCDTFLEHLSWMFHIVSCLFQSLFCTRCLPWSPLVQISEKCHPIPFGNMAIYWPCFWIQMVGIAFSICWEASKSLLCPSGKPCQVNIHLKHHKLKSSYVD